MAIVGETESFFVTSRVTHHIDDMWPLELRDMVKIMEFVASCNYMNIKRTNGHFSCIYCFNLFSHCADTKVQTSQMKS